MVTPLPVPGCPLCESPGGRLVFEAPLFRVVDAQEAGFPAFYRLIWNAHVAEWSDLPAQQRQLTMEAVTCVEQALRDVLQPSKINLASLGNQVPHLHWHVIARFDWDSHFPAPIWAEPLRGALDEKLAAVAAHQPALEAQIHNRLQTLRVTP